MGQAGILRNVTDRYWQPSQRVSVLGHEVSERLFGRFVGSALIAMVLAMFAAPRSAPFQLGLVLILAIAVMLRDRRNFVPVLRPSVPVMLLLLFCGFAMLSALWARDPTRSFQLALMFAANVLAGILLVRWIDGETGERLARLGLGLLIGLTLGLAFLAFEMATGQLLKRMLFNLDSFRPDTDKHFGIRNGEIVRIATYYLNRGIAVMVLLVWPVALIAALWPVKSRRRLMVYGFFITATALTAFSAHETSKLALLLSFAGFALAQVSAKWAWRVLYASWVVVLVGAVPLSLYAHRNGLHEAQWLQDFRARAHHPLGCHGAAHA